MSTTTVDNIQIVISADTQKAIGNLEKVTASLSSIGNATDKSIKPMSKATNVLKKIDVALSAALLKVTKYASGAFKESNDYVEAVNLFNVTMGKGTEAAQKYANELQNLMGIDSKEWMSYQGSLNQMLVGFGTAEDKANEMSQQLTQVAYDLSSVWNVDVSEAFHKVQSGLSGQVKGLKTWGINLSVAQLRETALAHGITLSTAKMTEQQKATLRYITIMEKTKNVQGDLARTIISPANAMRILNNQLVLLKRAFGQIVSVLVAKFIPYVQAAVKAITQLAESVAKAFGYKLPDIDYSKMQSLSTSANDLDENLTDSTKSAKKLKKTLAGFDEINQLADFSDSASDLNNVLGGGLPGDFGLDLSQYAYDFDANIITTKVNDVLQKILGIGGALIFIAGALLAFSGVAIFLGIGMMATGAGMMFAAAALNWSATGKKLSNTIAGIIVVTGMIALVIGAILTFTGANIFIGIALMVLGATAMVSAATIAWGGLSDELKSTLTDLMEVVGIALVAIGCILAFGVPGQQGLGIALIIGGLAMTVSAVALKWGVLNEQLSKAITDLLKLVSTAMMVIGAVLMFGGINIPLGIVLIVAGLATRQVATLDWESLKDHIGDAVSKVLKILGGALVVIGAILAFSGVAFPLGFALFVAGAGALTGGVAMSEIDWDKLKGKINSSVSAILKVVGKALLVVGAILAFSGVALLLGIGLMAAGGVSLRASEAKIDWKALPNKIKEVMNGVISWVEKGINKVISLINSFSFSWDVPEFLQEDVGSSKIEIGFSLSKVSIPRLANGGVVNEGQAFIARERGPELVGNVGKKTAVMNNDQIVESVSNGVYRAMKEAMSENTEDGQTEINVYVGGELAYRDFVKRHNAEVNVKGYSPLKI